jgi:hypothetical protein
MVVLLGARAGRGGANGKLAPLRVEDIPPGKVPPLLHPLLSRDLFGVGEETARRELLAAVAGPERLGYPPAFPGNSAHLSRKRDFFVSYTQADRHWAEWIAWVLEEDGYRVLIQAWDFVPGSNAFTYLDGVWSAPQIVDPADTNGNGIGSGVMRLGVVLPGC